ncbi:MAG: D-2-hydroxyacid dehydrogenase [Clostridia bacterium]|nr:D-2-hydroxyacid dehydrogenase [Clostridia bacterium]
MKIAVLDCCTVTNGDVSLSPLEQVGEVRYFDLLPPDQVAAAIGDSDAVVVNKARITAEIMDACPNLRFVGLFATGYNNIDVEAADKRGIAVCNVPGYSTDSVAQHTFALILHFASHADDYAASVKREDWIQSKAFSYFAFPVEELCGKTLGIVGYGTIGRAVAKIALAFGMNVIALPHHPMGEGDGPVRFVDKATVFSKADYLSLHCPLNEETRELVNAETLSWMKPSAVLINTARGGVTDEQAVADALNEGRLRGAGIDVLCEEPMRAGHPFLTAKHCYVTPHVAWGSLEARTRLVTMVADNLKAFEAGHPIHCVGAIR